MQIIENQKIEDFIDEDSREIFENIEFNKCTFENCRISQTNNPFYRSTVRNIVLKDCKIRNCDTGNAIIEDVLIENLTTNGLLQIYGSAYKHVTIKGKIGSIMLCNFMPSNITTDEEQEAIIAENKEYYSSIDWSIDISQAEFIECDIRGIPSKLIKRDTETQMILTKEKALQIQWEKLPLQNRVFRVVSDMMFHYNYDDILLIAEKRAKDFNELMHDLKVLKEHGYVY